MAIVQISRIQIRRGLQQDLPQLASAEMGWSIDSQRLFIGNGTFDEGAPTEGVTEILTENSLISITSGLTANVAILQSNVAVLQANVATLQAAATPITRTLGAASAGSVVGIAANNAVVSYTLNQGGTVQRRGTLNFSRQGATVIYQDDYTETSETDIVLTVTGNATAANLAYTTTTATTFTYLTEIL